MITIIKKGSTAETVKEKFRQLEAGKNKESIKRYCGILKLKKDPVKLQKEWRDEWE
ncbi:hypothetical protein ACG2F4_19275 [Halalkalibaculum sp. DA3122]|uniref:hypothetical protein n=1 Tax=unclassified Halalkalibaculum TaxID=2964617 RepID=UPI003754E62C